MTTWPGPTIAGYTTFLRDYVQVPVEALPVDSPWIAVSFQVAIEIVYRPLRKFAPAVYEQAVYNLATSNLFNYAQDVAGAPTLDVNGKQLPYFAAFRAKWNIYGFVSGVVQSTADVTTSTSLLVPDFMKGLTLANLQLLKDPYGLRYLQLVQSLGGLWGLSG